MTFFTCELAKRITVPVEVEFMSVSSYGSGTESSGIVKIVQDLSTSIEGKNVIVVEDIIDTGRTLFLYLHKSNVRQITVLLIIIKTITYYELVRYLKSDIVNLHIHNSAFRFVEIEE